MSAAELAARVRALEGSGDPVGLALVRTLLERSEALPASGRTRLIARAEALLATYQTRRGTITPEPRPPAQDEWRETLEARARQRTPRVRTDERASFVAEILASAATARAAERVPEAAGPYNGAVVASRALAELAELSPGYVSRYVAWLEDLASLAELPERRPPRRKP